MLVYPTLRYSPMAAFIFFNSIYALARGGSQKLFALSPNRRNDTQDVRLIDDRLSDFGLQLSRRVKSFLVIFLRCHLFSPNLSTPC